MLNEIEQYWNKIFAIIIAVIIILAIVCTITVFADEYTFTFDEIVEAIYKAEGGAKAQYVYGIRSVKYKDKAEARRICLNSVRNNHKRWLKAGSKEDFLEFMSRRFCPIGCDNDRGTNRYWVKNVKYFLTNAEK